MAVYTALLLRNPLHGSPVVKIVGSECTIMQARDYATTYFREYDFVSSVCLRLNDGKVEQSLLNGVMLLAPDDPLGPRSVLAEFFGRIIQEFERKK